jgi:tripartite-type tricarboxylate transporter receptor subunit TctC
MNRPHRRHILQLAAGALALPAISRGAMAQSWPTRPIRAVVPFGAGSAVDVAPRVVLDRLSLQLGQPIVVENRAGAGGTIGAGTVAKSDPDGYTLLVTSSALTVAPSIFRTLPYDTVRDFAAVASLGSLPNVMVVSPAKGLPTIQSFVAAAKAKPGSFNFASAGVGTATQMSAERFRISAGFDAVHLPMKGGSEAMTEVLAGRAEFYFSPIGTALPFIREGKLLGLVVSGAKRAPELPEVPTTSEAGFRDADYTFWMGMFAPSKTPRDIVNKLHAETVAALRATNVQERLAMLGVAPMAVTPEQFDAQIKDEIVSSAALVKAAGIKPE